MGSCFLGGSGGHKKDNKIPPHSGRHQSPPDFGVLDLVWCGKRGRGWKSVVEEASRGGLGGLCVCMCVRVRVADGRFCFS